MDGLILQFSKNLLLGSEHLLSIFHDVSSQFSSLDEIERYFTKFIDENFLEKKIRFDREILG